MENILSDSGITSGDPKLIVEGLSKSYGSAMALQPIDLRVAAGEFLTLLGPSGSGKTTLLQMICGLVAPTAGRVLIDGRDETATPVHQRDIGLVFQNYALFPHFTVSENIAFPLKMRRLSAQQIREKVQKALDVVQLEPLAHRFPRELSGGQQQRVALARCFVYEPSVILMDEPLGALDKKLREHMQFEIKRLHRETGATIIYVTHDQDEALALSDRVCLMNYARVEQIDTPRRMYKHPATAFAADFIGLSNIFRGAIVKNDQGLAAMTTRHGQFLLPEGNWDSGVELGLVVRPEHIELDGRGSNRLNGTVADVVYGGAETRFLVVADGEKIIVRLGTEAAVPLAGESVTISWRPECSVVVP